MELLKTDLQKICICYLLILNATGFFLMGIDKWKARHKRWRIAEKTLFAVSLLGGSLGTWAGIYVFRHKTKHWYFVVGMPLIFVLQVFFLLTFK